MKLRQKLAAALAATMVVTAVPVTTMAATPTVNTVTAVKDSTLGYTTTGSIAQAPQVDLYFELSAREKQLVSEGRNHIFYLEIKDGEFAEEDRINAGATNATIVRLSKSELKVTITTVNGVAPDAVVVPLFAKVTGDEPRVIVDGANSVVESRTLALTTGTVSGQPLTATASKATLPVAGGEIGKITIAESVLKTLEGASKKIILELPSNSDVVFEDITSVNLKGLRGLSGKNSDGDNIIPTTAEAKLVAGEKGKQLEITLPQSVGAQTIGSIEITGVKIEHEDGKRKDLDSQEVKVTILKVNDFIAKTELVVAEIKEEGVSLTVKEAKEIVAGKGTQKVIVVLKETAPGSLDERHDIYFKVDNAEIVKAEVKDDDTKEVDAEVVDKEDDEFYVKLSDKNTKAATIEIELELRADVDVTGDVVVTAESRSLDTHKVTVAEVVAPVTVKSTSVTLEAGNTKQAGGSITIKETEAGNLKRGYIALSIDSRYGVYFSDKNLTIETTEGLAVKVDSIKNDDQLIILEVTKTSKEAAELTISGFAFDVDATVPTGAMKLEIGGSALANANGNIFVDTKDDDANALEDTIVIKDFIKVAAAVVPGQEKVEAAFTMSTNTYVVNGEVKVMDVAPYVSAEGRTMVPVRFLADALGLPEQALAFNVVDGKGVVTIIADSKVITLVNGEKTLTVNGATLPLTSAVTIKDGRTFTPVTEIATVLGMSANWDAATQTATFSK
jgi:hypothetical protein